MYAQNNKFFYNFGKWGDTTMLIKSLDNSMEKAMRFERITKATKFGNASAAEMEKTPEKELMMLKKISQYSKEELYTDEENKYDITEAPKRSNFAQIAYKGNTPACLPFFRSIQFKLSEVFSV